MRRGLAGGLVVCVVAAVCIAIVEAEQPSPGRANAYVVQLTGPVLESWKTALAEAGADLQEYVPQFAFRVRMTPDAAARVRRLAFRVVGRARSRRAQAGAAPAAQWRAAVHRAARAQRGAAAMSKRRCVVAGAQVLRRGSQLMIVADSTELDRLADDRRPRDDRKLRAAHQAQRVWRRRDPGQRRWPTPAASTARRRRSRSPTPVLASARRPARTPTSRRRASARSSTGPASPDFCFETIANDGAQDVDSGHGTHVATAALGAGNASGAGRGTAPAAHTWSSRRSKTTRCRRCCAACLRVAGRAITSSAFPTTSVTSSTRRTSRTRACIRTRGAPKSPARIPPTAPTPMRSSGRIAISPSPSRPATPASTATATALSTGRRSMRPAPRRT